MVARGWESPIVETLLSETALANATHSFVRAAPFLIARRWIARRLIARRLIARRLIARRLIAKGLMAKGLIARRLMASGPSLCCTVFVGR